MFESYPANVVKPLHYIEHVAVKIDYKLPLFSQQKLFFFRAESRCRQTEKHKLMLRSIHSSELRH